MSISVIMTFPAIPPGESNVVADGLNRKNMGIMTDIAIHEWCLMENLADYRLTFIEAVELTDLYELIARLWQTE